MTETRRYPFLDVPVDAIDPESVMSTVLGFSTDKRRHHLVLLTLRKLMRARRDNTFFAYLNKASLILPVSRGIIRGARFQRKTALHRYEPFDFVIRLLTLAEEHRLTVYLLGGLQEDVLRVEANLRTSFLSLQIVGRYTGHYTKKEADNVLMGIRKASPSLLLVGSGVPEGEKWLLRHAKQLNPGIAVWVDNCFEIFAGKEKRPQRDLFQKGLESLPGVLFRPWRWIRLLPFLYFKFLVLAYRITGR